MQASKFKSVYLIWNVKEISSWPIELLKGTSIRFFSWLLSLAVAYECTRTITSIYPDKDLIDKAARCVGVFLVAKSNDIKYLGKWFKCFFFPTIHHSRGFSHEYCSYSNRLFVASPTRRVVSAKRLFRDLSEFNSTPSENGAQSPFHKFKMLAVWPSNRTFTSLMLNSERYPKNLLA